jgi:hypothetical protein
MVKKGQCLLIWTELKNLKNSIFDTCLGTLGMSHLYPRMKTFPTDVLMAGLQQGTRRSYTAIISSNSGHQ